MTDDARTFKKLRHEAAREFAQTMIVIDDEASHGAEVLSPQPAGPARSPSRATRAAATTDASAEPVRAEKPDSHKLDAKSLIDKAMDLGLICSVLRPKENENFRHRVVRAAQVADIVCLDWDIHKDSGEAASEIIGDIIQKDAERNGRLRLIAIYTGIDASDRILEKILETIPEELKVAYNFRQDEDSLKIESKNGVRIVCLFKTHGIQLREEDRRKSNQVGEDQLPERLQTEFAELSEGLLSNVALATIASIRSSTHHVLSKFTSQMDGPFFHHRALIDNPDDAEEYAVDIVLSELKGAVDKQQVATIYAGSQAIGARIRDIAGDAETLTFRDEKGSPRSFDLKTVVKIVTDGLERVRKEVKPPNLPNRKTAQKSLSSLFINDGQETVRSLMHQFAALTGVRAYPGSHPYQSGQLVPRLGLGTIIRDENRTYLMCLQASCDSVRIKDVGNFLFVPLDPVSSDAEDMHVVPVPSPRQAHESEYIGLSTSKASYQVVRSIKFLACQETKTVNAKRIDNWLGFRFEDMDGKSYLWIADLKHQRALRTVQRLGRHMGRLGFDEFEPYRQKEE